MHFLIWTFVIFDSNITEIGSLVSNKQYSGTGSDNDLVTNDGLGYWRIYASLGLNELIV